jgi:hypothetical protein
MSETPETDAAQHEGLLRTNPIPLQVVTASFARKLERERDEARDLAQQMSESNQVLMADVLFYRNAWEQLKEGAK